MANSPKIKTPQPLWAVWGNGYGFNGPVKVYWNRQLNSWWSKCGNKDIPKPGLTWNNNEAFCFSSPHLVEVKKFCQGYAACAQIVRNAITVN